ncbi:hypothetical protein V492_00359 [Pseudogymnoascus sp. VKM F-4246]|nr:hypothetical protein V492_00359 [Pseudogymnoascus sp. VKM F-4246]
MSASSSALNGDNLGYSNVTRVFPEFAQATEKRQNRVALRILPFGASIMSGVGSSTNDGLRKYLRDALRLDGWEVNMVGSLSSGEMKDKNHEAVPADIITEAQKRLRNSVGFKPNVVIINLGTNDAVNDVDVSQAGIRMESVLDEIWGAEGMAETCIMLSTLIPNTAEVAARNRPIIDDQFRALVDRRAGKNCIYLADMEPNGEEWFAIEDDFLTTENPHTHPNSNHEQDNGHRKMAAIFYQAINQAASDDKIVAAGDFGAGEPFCDKFDGTGVDAGGKTQRGSGYEDQEYSHDSEEMPIIWTFDSQWDRDQWRFARLFSPDYDDLVAWVQSDDDFSAIYATWANSANGKGEFTKIDDMDSDLQCDQDGMHFIDMTGDGLDDFVCITRTNNPEGEATLLAVNQGDGDRDKNKPPTFKRVGENGDIIGKKEKREDIILGDIDGDGRGDYGVVTRGDDGISVEFWRNGGVGSPEYWQPLGTFFNSGDPNALLRFEDLNGDGRDDWLAMNEDGSVATNTNSRSCGKGVVGDGLDVAWRKGTLRGEQGLTHLGPPGVESPISDRIHFARIYGEASAFGNLPKQDYVYMQHSKVGDDHRFEMRVWKNLGKGGTKIRVDGNKYCNMMGHDDGSVDYVWAYQGGEMEMWSNRGKKTITDDDPDGFWDYSGIIWSPPQEMHRKDLHLADWDGDGDCDIIYVDPDNNNAIEVWLNERPQKGTWEWTHLSNPAPSVTCSESRGIGINDLAVRFADLTNNSRADYLCIKPDGYISAFLHLEDGSWENAGQIKSPEGKDRANLRWADVNGDGLDDMIWIEKFSGDTWVWYNGGRGSPETGGGSSFYWRRQDQRAYAGLAAGSCIFYADLDGNGRADEHYVLESFNNIAYTSMSPSCGLSDVTGDDDDMDGGLPEPPTSNPTV